MLDLKPYGAFIENTIRPLLEEFKWMIKELSASGLQLNEKSLGQLFRQIAGLHLRSLLVSLIRDVTVTLIIAFVVWQILK